MSEKQLFVGECVVPIGGCDTLQNLVDDVLSEFAEPTIKKTLQIE